MAGIAPSHLRKLRSLSGSKRADCMGDFPEVNGLSSHDLSGGDFREGTQWAESGLPKEVDDRLTLRAAAWQRGRWDTTATADEINARVAARGGKPTLKELITLKMFEHITATDSKLHGQAMRSAMRAEAMNQRDEHASLNAGTDPQAQGVAPVAPDQIAAAMDDSVPGVAAG